MDHRLTHTKNIKTHLIHIKWPLNARKYNTDQIRAIEIFLQTITDDSQKIT